jgi:NDP-mannose synthase
MPANTASSPTTSDPIAFGARRAVVLAGGRGTRLAPYTITFPKPLMPVGDVPILEVVLRQLRHFGFRRVTLAVGHLSSLIRAYVDSNRARLDGLEIDYHEEDRATGTAGALATVDGLDGTFVAMNGDVLTTLDYDALLRRHRERGAALTIAVCEKKVKIDLGVLEADADGDVSAYHEKPEPHYLVSMGVYVYEPRAVALIGPGERIDFPDLVKRLLDRGERVATYRWDGYWLDIGRPEDYAAATEVFAQRASEFHLD